jgi:hypothetical protein
MLYDAVIVVVGAALVYGNTLHASFTFDDNFAVVRHAVAAEPPDTACA